MNQVILIVFFVCIFGCVPSHRFADSNTRISPYEKIPINTIETAKLIVVGFNSPSFDKTAFHPISLFSRPDSIKVKLERELALISKNYVNIDLYRNEYTDTFFNSMRHIYLSEDDYGGKKARFMIDSLSLEKIGMITTNKIQLIFIFRLQTSEAEYSSPMILDFVLGSVLIVNSGRIDYYRQFRSVVQSQRRFFPKGSEDREAFPHFPQRQIERVVDALVEDLKTRVQ